MTIENLTSPNYHSLNEKGRSFTPHPYGEDLVSNDVLRGRDNGIPPYVDMLRHLTGGWMKVTEFDDLAHSCRGRTSEV
ncbi:hypothetical protein JTE90_024460 [Oedothorax gibbosus]|uniref:Uncharacterized protein n=1 Tax=Oedothorax gibbosus TaxID=931172 RepID=A0AAV6TQ15_9ARAC|nr:hypothetical protein JTE90_024460 [Oedothorax gibbosus]